MNWTESEIAREISVKTLAKKCVVLVDRCNWTGYECDVLAVTTDLRIIDIEIKISRSDLKADAKKDKWWHRSFGRYAGVDPATGHAKYVTPDPIARQWPPKVWKHYYAMPAEIWKPELLDCLPSPASGVLLLSRHDDGWVSVACKRRATPCRDADRLKTEQVMNIARLANIRMWNAYDEAKLKEKNT